MWICPKCGREFKRTNQDHFCGKAPETVPEYIDFQPSENHSHLKELMTAIRDNQSPLLFLKSMLVFMSVL